AKVALIFVSANLLTLFLRKNMFFCFFLRFFCGNACDFKISVYFCNRFVPDYMTVQIIGTD
ncbi:MAG: hypothetical protein UH850_00660, partial [Paludibacteraceae bacterium]|nr:hypothetical protein [Paludibacteraceae bacterium]